MPGFPVDGHILRMHPITRIQIFPDLKASTREYHKTIITSVTPNTAC